MCAVRGDYRLKALWRAVNRSWRVVACLGAVSCTNTGTGPTSGVGGALKLVKVAGDTQTAVGNHAVRVQPSVRLEDLQGHAVRTVAVEFLVTTGHGSVTGQAGLGDTVFTDSTGLATATSWTLSVGTNVLTVVAPRAKSVAFTATGAAFKVARISAGDGGACAQTSPTATWCWGDDYWHELGTGGNSSGYPSPNPEPVALQHALPFDTIYTGGRYACGLTSGGLAYCWGYTYPDYKNYPFVENFAFVDTVPTLVGGGLTFTSLVAGGDVTCGLVAGGAAYCWGDNRYGQSGNGKADTNGVTIATPVVGGHTFITLGASNSSGDGPDAGGHVCGVTSSGAAFCWGENTWGQLGTGTQGGPPPDSATPTPVPVTGLPPVVSMSAGISHTCALTSSGEAFCWGYNGHGELGDGTTVSRPFPSAVQGGLVFQALAAGGDNTCGLVASGTLYCWGLGGYVGDGTTVDRTAPTMVTGGITFRDVSVSGVANCGVAIDGAAYCWGQNQLGELGDATYRNRLSPVAVAPPGTPPDTTRAAIALRPVSKHAPFTITSPAGTGRNPRPVPRTGAPR